MKFLSKLIQRLERKETSEEFPGLIYRMQEPKVVILMFASGKLVCTGAKTEKEVYEAVYKLKNILEENQLITYVTTK